MIAPSSGRVRAGSSRSAPGLGPALALLAVATTAVPAMTAQITVLCPRGVEVAVGHVAEEFRAESGTRIRLVLGTAGGLARQAAAGEPGDGRARFVAAGFEP